MSEAAVLTAPTGKPLVKNELLKLAIPTLAGNLAATLKDDAAACFSSDDEQFLKFHGIYQQDDRDQRKIAKHYLWMIRGRIPGGILSSPGYLVYDDLATRYGNRTLRLTSRQSIQFHGVVKAGLGPLMRELNQAMLDTRAACGDVNRNVMAPVVPSQTEVHRLLVADARRVSEGLLPKTKAYHAIWVEGVQLNLEAPENKEFVDPLYGKQYLPRKFKVAFALGPLNDVDLFTNCLGFIGIEDNGQLAGYNLTAGGGLGRSHGNDATYARLADVIGFVTREQIVAAARAVLTIHRDFGDRTDRKHARLKYVLEERGVAWFRAELERRLGFALGEPRAFQFTRQGDTFGWGTASDGSRYLGLYVETGRIKDAPNHRLKSALIEIARRFGPEFRITPSQNLVLANFKAADESAVTAVLAEHGIPVTRQTTPIRRNSMACPSLPTCGLGLAESERYLSKLMGELEGLLQEVGLPDEEIIIRMTGCPNGCARPYMAEIGLVGKAPGRYQLYLGGNETCTRLNRVYKDVVKEPEVVNELRPLLQRFRDERQGAERFGDWAARVIWAEKAAAN